MPKKIIRKIMLAPNIEKPQVPSVVDELIRWFNDRDVEVVMQEEDADRLNKSAFAADENQMKACDVVVCLGGDGTILRAVRILKGAPIPIVGVNFGRVGFLSEIEVNEMYPAMELLLDGDFSVDERMMLKCSIKSSDFEMQYFALNEIVVERGRHQRIMEFDVFINDSRFSRYTADGLIVATPTGSTAYSFSAGGPIVYPSHELILLAPISPHSLFGRTMVLAANDKIRIELPKRIEALVGIDGFCVMATIIDAIEVEKAEPKAYFIKLKDKSFYALFKEKLRLWDTWLR